MTSQTESEFQEFESSNAWHGVFQRLKNEASIVMLGEDISTSCARHPDNRRRNRYRDVSPYNHSRIILQGQNDYINASLVEVPEVDRKYILTQGPLDHTISDFWQMTWEQKSKAVVMLNRVIEKGTIKCSQYWPLGLEYGYEDEMFLPECGLKLSLIKEQNMGHFLLRTLILEKIETEEKREVLQFHYTTWPDFGVPSSPLSFLNFLHAVRQTGSLDPDVGPAIIHCSAGIGRSGTFCLVDSCLVLVENNSTLDCVDVRQTLIKMRYFRMGLIQTPDQLKFSYLAIIQGAAAVLKGGGLGNLDLSASNDMNHTEGGLPPAPTPPQRTSSLSPESVISGQKSEMDAPPPLPPKKSKMIGDLGPWGEEDDSEDEEFDELIVGKEEPESSEESDEDEEIKAAELRQRIREERKKETMEKIRQMKERQRKSERYRQYRSYFGPKFYFGLAIIVGLAGIAVYKYWY